MLLSLFDLSAGATQFCLSLSPAVILTTSSRSAWAHACLMLMWAPPCALFLCHRVRPLQLWSPSPLSPREAPSNPQRCAITEMLRINPLPLRSGWAAPSSAPALARTPCQPTTALNRCPLCPRRGNLATKSSQSSLELKKVRQKEKRKCKTSVLLIYTQLTCL